MVLVACSCASTDPVATAADLGAARSFVDAYEAFSRSSMSFTEVAARTAGGNSLPRGEVTVIQSFPDRVSVGEHLITGVSNGRRIGCTDAAGTMECRDNGNADASAEAEARLEGVRSEVLGEQPRWTVTAGADEGCYEVVATTVELVSRWGSTAELCFAPDSGLLVSEVINFTDGSDTTERTLISLDVDPADVAAAFPIDS